MDGRNDAVGARLRSYVDRICRLEDEKASLAADIKDVFAEAAGEGFDKKALRRIVAEKRESESAKRQRQETEAIADVYRAALGMLDGTPLGDAARKRLAAQPDDDPEESEGAPPSEPADAPGSPPATIDEAREMGRDAAKAGKSIMTNPYVAGDPRRAAWDEGWCAETGSDGMDIPPAFRRSPKKKPDEPGDDQRGDE